ncbi:MAG: hypothetical protein LC624_00905 [Halobacteriales archaeon]|nr:hypothetical protein [Halobacteriales archaeon]
MPAINSFELKTAHASHTYDAPGMHHIYVTMNSPCRGAISAPFIVSVEAPPTVL